MSREAVNARKEKQPSHEETKKEEAADPEVLFACPILVHFSLCYLLFFGSLLEFLSLSRTLIFFLVVLTGLYYNGLILNWIGVSESFKQTV